MEWGYRLATIENASLIFSYSNLFVPFSFQNDPRAMSKNRILVIAD